MTNRTERNIVWQGKDVQAVVFDMDGVMVDTYEAHSIAWEEFAVREGVSLDIEDFMRRNFGRGNAENALEIFPDRADDREFLLRKSDEKEEFFRDAVRKGKVRAIPGFLAYLEELRECGLALAVGSSAPNENIETVLECFDIEKTFQAVVGAGDVRDAKPDPAIFLECVRRLDVDPANVVIFEDSVHGLEAARRAGCRAVGLTTTHPEEQIAGLSDCVLEDFQNAGAILGWP